jgi:methyl-accepting chemotaxis protein
VTNAYIAEATEMVKFQQARSASLGQQIDAELVTARNTLWGVTAVCAAGRGPGLEPGAQHPAPLARLQDAARSIAQGDLSREVPTMAGDSEAAQLMHDVAQMQAALRQLVSQARQATDSIEVASREVAAGNTDLSARTEQAASSLEESASSMEELTGTVKHTAEAAQTANRLADGAEAVAQQGGAVMQQVVATMDGIHQASQKIADIIGVIDGIAFQTNILA